MNQRLIGSGMHWKSVCVTVCNEEQASLSHQTSFRVAVIHPPALVTITNAVIFRRAESKCREFSLLKHFEASSYRKHKEPAAWASQLEVAAKREANTGPPLCGGGHDNTKEHLTASTSKCHWRNERFEILCEESTNEGATFTGEHSTAAPWEPLFFLLFLPFAILDKHLFDAKQCAAFPTYTRISSLHQSLSLFSAARSHLLLSHNDS